MKPKKQLNTRVPLKMAESVRSVADYLGWAQDDVSEVAYAILFGTTDGLLLEKRKKVEAAARDLGIDIDDCAVSSPRAGEGRKAAREEVAAVLAKVTSKPRRFAPTRK